MEAGTPDRPGTVRRLRLYRLAPLALVLALAAPAAAPAQAGPTATSQLLHKDVLVDADLWSRTPKMLAAGLGFTNIIGVPGIGTDDLAGSEQTVRAVGGTWNTIACAPGETPPLSAYTSASTPQQVAFSFGFPATVSDGLPVVGPRGRTVSAVGMHAERR